MRYATITTHGVIHTATRALAEAVQAIYGGFVIEWALDRV